LAAKRDERKDSFVRVLRKAMTTRLGEDADETLAVLGREGVPRELSKKALELAVSHGRLTIFAVVDALTRLSQSVVFVGDRTELDAKIGSLLALAA
jgi:histone H3/H4